MDVCINEECHYHYWDSDPRNCSRETPEGLPSYYHECLHKVIGEHELEDSANVLKCEFCDGKMIEYKCTKCDAQMEKPHR